MKILLLQVFVVFVVQTCDLLRSNIAAAAPPLPKDGGGDSSHYKLICYYSSWASYRPSVGSFSVDDIPVQLCTHIVYAFIGVNNRTWELLVLDPLNDITKGGYRRFTSLKKKNPNVKALISVGGWVEGGQKYSDMVSTPERRKIFVNSVLDFLKWFNFDGLELDWEFPGSLDRDGKAEDKENFIRLVQELRDAFDKEGWGWILTAAVPIIPFRVKDGYDVKMLSNLVDHIQLLTYDLRGNWTGFTDVHTPLRRRQFDAADYENVNLHNGSRLWQSLGVAEENLVVGLAFYGRTYTLADPSENGLRARLHASQTSGDRGPYTKANGTLAYYEICELIRSGGWDEKYDTVGESPYVVKGNQWIGYDNQHSLTEKVKFVESSGFGGVAVWSVDLDDFKGICGQPYALLQTVYQQLLKKSVSEGTARVSPAPGADAEEFPSWLHSNNSLNEVSSHTHVLSVSQTPPSDFTEVNRVFVELERSASADPASTTTTSPPKKSRLHDGHHHRRMGTAPDDALDVESSSAKHVEITTYSLLPRPTASSLSRKRFTDLQTSTTTTTVTPDVPPPPQDATVPGSTTAEARPVEQHQVVVDQATSTDHVRQQSSQLFEDLSQHFSIFRPTNDEHGRRDFLADDESSPSPAGAATTTVRPVESLPKADRHVKQTNATSNWEQSELKPDPDFGLRTDNNKTATGLIETVTAEITTTPTTFSSDNLTANDVPPPPQSPDIFVSLSPSSVTNIINMVTRKVLQHFNRPPTSTVSSIFNEIASTSPEEVPARHAEVAPSSEETAKVTDVVESTTTAGTTSIAADTSSSPSPATSLEDDSFVANILNDTDFAEDAAGTATSPVPLTILVDGSSLTLDLDTTNSTPQSTTTENTQSSISVKPANGNGKHRAVVPHRRRLLRRRKPTTTGSPLPHRQLDVHNFVFNFIKNVTSSLDVLSVTTTTTPPPSTSPQPPPSTGTFSVGENKTSATEPPLASSHLKPRIKIKRRKLMVKTRQSTTTTTTTWPTDVDHIQND